MSSPPARVRRSIFRFSIVCKDARVFGLSFAPSRVDRVVSELSLYRLRSAFYGHRRRRLVLARSSAGSFGFEPIEKQDPLSSLL
jgi:hypothetical protein